MDWESDAIRINELLKLAPYNIFFRIFVYWIFLNVHRLELAICKRMTALVDTHTKVIKLTEDAVIHISNGDDVWNAVNGRISKCFNLCEVDLTFVSPYNIALVWIGFMKEMVRIAPRIQHIKTYEQSN